MDILSTTALRLTAHVLSFGLALAVVVALIAAQGRSLDMRYWRLLVAVLTAYAAWFFMLSISVRDAELLRRGEITWLFGAMELAAALGGWAWFGLTAHASFCLPGDKGQELRGGSYGD